ncbi:MAG: PQQ-like beta-propeller repeat protein [Akkermansiaceae bacterium]|nr:PQQ-like beta-propeller repeat protein [Akkermansiaceae bacterium]
MRISIQSIVRFLVFGVVWGAAVPLPAADWPQWRGPARDGKSAETRVIKGGWDRQPPKLLWMGTGLGAGYASVAVVGDRIYTTGDLAGGQGVVAVNAKDGKVIWATPVTDGPPKHSFAGARCTPTVEGGLLWVTASNGMIACLDTTGKVVWKKDFKEEWGGRMMSGWGFAESVLLDGEAVVCTPGSPDAMMVKLDKKTGAEIWKCAVPEFGEGKGKDGAGYGSAVISNAAGVKQYVQITGRGLIGVRAADGKFLWGYDRAANSTANISTPVVAGDHVFCSTAYGAGSGLVKLSKDGDGVKMEEVYFIGPNKLQNHHGGMVLVDGHIFCGHRQNGGDPVCVDIRTGELKWGPEKPPGKGSAAVTYVDGHLIFRYQDGTLALVKADPKAFKLLGTFKPEYQEKESWAHPVVSGGRLYLREQDKLMCYQL